MPKENIELQIQFIITIIIAIILIGSIIIFFISYQKKKLIQEKKLSEIKASLENQLLLTQLEIQEETMKSISMDIHDNIGQIMLLANIHMSTLEMIIHSPQAPSLIDETKKLLSKASEDISNLARSLHSDRITELGVFQAIKIELTQLSEKKIFKIAITDQQEISGKNLTRETQLLIFRMYQEIIKNTIKHANATIVTMQLDSNLEGINLVFGDNGKGFVTPAAVNPISGGVGMHSLKTRAELFQGSIQIQSEPGKGTITTIFIPVKSKH